MTKKINTALSIGRTYGSGPDTIRLEIIDEDARVTLVEQTLTLEQFAQAITGMMLSGIPAETLVQDNRIGKNRVVETRRVQCPMSAYTSRDKLREWLEAFLEETDPEGVYSSYLGSRGSVQSCPNEPEACILMYSKYTWEDKQ